MPASSHPRRATLQEDSRGFRPRVTTSQATVVGAMAFAMWMGEGCGMTRMCSARAACTGQPMQTRRHTEREMDDEKAAKAGGKRGQKRRREVHVEEHVADLLRGVINRWQGAHLLVLAMDASALADRVTIRSFSVVSRGCAIRVAWTLTAGGEEGAWRPHGERVLRVLAEAVPTDGGVCVMADRGRDAAWLVRAIQANGWHPFVRVTKGLGIRAAGEDVGERVTRPGREGKGQGAGREKGDRMEGTVLVRWEQGEEEPIGVVSDRDPKQATTAWEHRRLWIECDCKDGTRGWFHWEQTTRCRPERASRLWLVLAVVMQKAILLGGAVEAQEKEATARQRSKHRGKRRSGRPLAPVTKPRGREQRVLVRGMMAWRAAEKKP